MTGATLLHAARERMLGQDLLDALWLEDLHGVRCHCHVAEVNEDGHACLTMCLGTAGTLHWHGRRLDGPRPLQLLSPVTLRRDGAQTQLAVAAVLEVLQSADWWPRRSVRLASLFALAEAQAEHTFAHEAATLARLAAAPTALSSWEALCCLRDRPFHPLARAKAWDGVDGLADIDAISAAGYDAESGRALTLHWIAVPRDLIRTGDIPPLVDQPIAQTLLTPAEASTLLTRAIQHGAGSQSHLWLPVHPWQWQQWRQQAVPPCIDLGAIGQAWPTASLRSLALHDRPGIHLKLALGMQALGAKRTLPARYLHNGALAQRCLETLRVRDAWLGAHLHLCDEREWWTVREHDTLIDEPGNLGCVIRRYPADMPSDTWLLPMAACAALTSDGKLPALRALHTTHGSDVLQPAWQHFLAIAALLLESGLRCFAHGVMPELHGQNVLLAIRHGAPVGLVLRDHDTLRICPRLMREAGVETPSYEIDRATPNTLILDTPAQLLAYFQTLAVGVNLYAIAAAIATATGDDEATGWRILREETERLLAPDGPLPASAMAARDTLLDDDDWPFKQLLAPLLARDTAGTGMPSAMGRITNPLKTAIAEVAP